MSRHQIAHRVRAGSWRALRRAVYIQERRYAVLTVREQHTTAVVVTLMTRPDGVVASRGQPLRCSPGSSRHGAEVTPGDSPAGRHTCLALPGSCRPDAALVETQGGLAQLRPLGDDNLGRKTGLTRAKGG
jgi:hypothetical protein